MSVKKNYFYITLYNFLLLGLPLITLPYLSRVLKPEGIGEYSYVLNVVNFCCLFILLGIPNYGNRSTAFAKDDPKKLCGQFFEIYSIQAIQFLVVFIVFGALIFFLDFSNRMLWFVMSIAVFAEVLDIRWFVFGLEKFKKVILLQSIIKILTIFFIFLLVKDTADLIIYASIVCIGKLFINLCFWLSAKNYLKPVAVKSLELKKHYREILLLFIPVLAYGIYKMMDKIMLGLMAGYAETGFYSNSEKIISIPITLIIGLGTVMLPRISSLMSQNRVEESQSYALLSIKFVCMFSCACIFGLIAVSNLLSDVLFGAEFAKCGMIIKVLSIIILPIGLSSVIRTQHLIPAKKDKIYVTSTIIGAVLNFITNLCLIPILGAIGATIGTIIAEFSVLIYQLVFVREFVKMITSTYRYFLIGAVMMVCVMAFDIIVVNKIVTLALQVVFGAVIFSSLTLVSLALTNDPLWQIIRSHFKKN